MADTLSHTVDGTIEWRRRGKEASYCADASKDCVRRYVGHVSSLMHFKTPPYILYMTKTTSFGTRRWFCNETSHTRSALLPDKNCSTLLGRPVLRAIVMHPVCEQDIIDGMQQNKVAWDDEGPNLSLRWCFPPPPRGSAMVWRDTADLVLHRCLRNKSDVRSPGVMSHLSSNVQRGYITLFN